jgi:hypothetical protein
MSKKHGRRYTHAGKLLRCPVARVLDAIDALLTQGLFSTASMDHRASR